MTDGSVMSQLISATLSHPLLLVIAFSAPVSNSNPREKTSQNQGVVADTPQGLPRLFQLCLL